MDGWYVDQTGWMRGWLDGQVVDWLNNWLDRLIR